MNKKPKQILELEEILGFKLFEITNPDEILEWHKSKNYLLNKKKEIIGLNLYYSDIEDLSFLQKLKSLTHLNLSFNRISAISFLSQLKNITHLDLSVNEISNYSSLQNLVNLTSLDLGRNLISDYSFLKKLENLTILNLGDCEISNASFLRDLKSLITLDLYSNKISDYSFLQDLKNLKNLDLNSNQISDASFLKELKGLTSLDLSFNPISDYSFLQDLKNLKSLNLNSNQISDISFLKNLIGLISLDLKNNKISDISVLQNFINLRTLDISINPITNYSFLQNLKTLKSLSLISSEITDISFLENLIGLTSLDLRNNKILDISLLKDLTDLASLDLRSNNVTDIASLQNLINLKSLCLSNNLISDISSLQNLKNLIFLQIDHNPFINDSRIKLKPFTNHLDTILNELLKVKQTKQTIKLPIKVMLLGNHGSGKSTFLEYFQAKQIKSDTQSTHILNIKSYPKRFKDLPKAIFFDFGGQDYYHGIYQAFLSLDSISLLFWRNKTDENRPDTDSKGQSTIHFNRKYWLGQLDFAFNQRKRYFQETTQEFIFAIQTHAESDSQSFFNHSSIAQSFYVSLKEQTPKFKAALTHLKVFLQEIIAEQSKSVEKTENEINLYKYILKQQNSHWTPVEALKDIYSTEINFLKAELEQLAMKGVVLYYKHISALEDVVWLNPSVTVKMIHEEILNDLDIRKAKGQVDKITFEEKVTDEKLIEMLKENKVIFLDKYSDTPKYIIPGYLPSMQESSEEYFIFGDFENADLSLKFENFIPFGFINQLICHFGKNPEKKTYRKDLLIFTTNNGKAKVLIRLDFETLEIKLFIKTSYKEVDTKKIQSDLFFDILQLYWGYNIPEDYDEIIHQMPSNKKVGLSIGKSSKNLKTKDLIEIITNAIEIANSKDFNSFEIAPEDMYISLDSRNFIHYKTLENTEETKGEILAYQKDNIGDLDKIKAKTISTVSFKHLSQNPNFKQMKKIFISYSKKDLPLVNTFLDHLSTLKLDNKIGTWYCTELLAGEEWDKTIQQNFDEADIVCFMISHHFMKTPYIHEYEIKNAFERKKNDSNFMIVPIILDFCTWRTKENNLGDFTALPYTAKPIKDFDNENMAWFTIVECLRIMIDKSEQPIGEDYFVNLSDKGTYQNNDLRNIFERIVSKKVDKNS